MAWSLVVAPLLCSPLVPHLDLPGLVSNLITNTSSSSFVYAAIFLKTLAVIRQLASSYRKQLLASS